LLNHINPTRDEPMNMEMEWYEDSFPREQTLMK
jgi:hypothetical protein